MITYYFKQENGDQLKTLDSSSEDAWLNVDNATEKDLAQIASLTGLRHADLDDILDPHELPRIERVGDNTIIFVRTPQDNSSLKGGEKYLYTDPLAIIINDKYFITLGMAKNSCVARLLALKSDVTTAQRGKLLIYLLLLISEEFVGEIRNVRKDVLSMQRKVKRVTDRDILNLVEDEEILNQYLSALVPMSTVLEQMVSGRRLTFLPDDNELLEDMINSTRQSIDLCTVNIKSIQSLRDSYQIVFTNRLNKTIKTLTLFTILMTIPMVLSSIYGMNIKLPLGDHPQAFLMLMVIAMLAMGAFVLYYRKKL